MIKKITLPKIGVNMTDAVISEWLVAPGQEIKQGDAILMAETDKATQEIETPESGVVAKLLVQKGDTVLCGEDILVLTDKGEAYTEDAEEAAPVAKAEPPSQKPIPASSRVVPVKISSQRIRISPLAKKTAKEMGIDYTGVQPSIPGGRIVKQNVVDYANTAGAAATRQTEPAKQESVPVAMNPIRKAIASKMAQSHTEIPSAAQFMTADAGAYLALKNKYKNRQMKLSVDAYIIKMAAKALKEHPDINAAWEDNGIVHRKDINIGVAVDTEKGLMVPVVKNANEKSLFDISNEIYDLAEAARQRKAGRDSLTGGTFTITNLGGFGVEQFVPIINPPECCILGVGCIRKVFVPDENDNPEVRSVMTLTLVHDHRIVDGAPVARFLRDLKYYIENPDMSF